MAELRELHEELARLTNRAALLAYKLELLPPDTSIRYTVVERRDGPGGAPQPPQPPQP